MKQYAAFGETTHDTLGVTRQSYIGKEKDVENGLGDHGVRKYDYETGRFNSIDPFWELYYGWTPYQYCMNNPIWAKDWDGFYVTYSGTKAEQTEMKNNINELRTTKKGEELYQKANAVPWEVNFKFEILSPQNGRTHDGKIESDFKKNRNNGEVEFQVIKQNISINPKSNNTPDKAVGTLANELSHVEDVHDDFKKNGNVNATRVQIDYELKNLPYDKRPLEIKSYNVESQVQKEYNAKKK